MSKSRILILILAFLTITIGSFIWYVATWDSAARADLATPFQSDPVIAAKVVAHDETSISKEASI